ncbi:MAG: Motility protein B [Pelotomaculum sp. PtaU1.Bin065]|nr:MAG: Motility protein B [Pelotomaculum sp. PtaU1.Bin065]
MKEKKSESSGKAGMERWLLTYSDLITLLMIFFVVMYALSSINSKKFEAIAVSLARAMGGGQSVLNNPGVSLAPGISAEAELTEENELERIKNELQAYIDQNGLNGRVTVSMEERGIVLSFQDVALFPSGSAQLTPYAKDLIVKVGQILIKTTQYIRVEGHTDDVPINTKEFPSNWELSVARATSVVQELIGELSFPQRRLSATGYGEYRPRVPNDTAENRQKNRRVDIVVLKSKYETAEPMALKPPFNEQNAQEPSGAE